MGKKKDSVALFEVITRNKERQSKKDLGVPGWMGKAGQAPQEQQAPRQEAPPEESQQQQAPAPPPQQRAEQVPPETEPETRAARAQPAKRLSAPSVSTEGGRLKLSLDYISCTAIAVGFIVLLAVAFWLGRTTSPQAPAQQAGMDAPYNPAVTGGRDGDGEAGGAQSPAAAPKRQKGKYYLVIQSMMGDSPRLKKEAYKIVNYCRKNGEPASVARYGDQLVVWSLTPFESPSGTEAKQHARAIEEMGKRYPGDYDFRQRRDGKFDPWFVKYKGSSRSGN